LSLNSVHDRLLEIYKRNDTELKHKLTIVLILAVSVGDIIGTIFDCINGLNNYWFNGLLFLICTISLFICLKYEKYDLGSNVMVITIAFFILPVMFFSEGGIHSGMTIWMFFAIPVAFLMMDGKARYIICFLIIMVDVCCFYIQYYYPNLVTVLDSEHKILVDVTESYVCVAVLLCSLILIHVKSYERQSIMLEKQRVELLEKQKELEKAVEEAIRADQAKGDFLANMSHEIRTPINAVLGMDELILREASNPDIIEYATNIQTSGKTLLSIINDILDFSKIEAGRMEVTPSEYSVADVINEVAGMIKPRLNDKRIDLVLKNNPNIPCKLWGDDNKLRQIILNLLTNAAKYTHVGTITVTTDFATTDEESILLKFSVNDTGIGIKEENIESLFQTFRRIDLKNNRSIEGTGLGLSLTKNLVELLGGSIGVESTYGVGSTFYFEVPQRIIDKTPIGQITQKTIVRAPKYKCSFEAPDCSVLVVDDTVTNIKVFCGLLKNTKLHIDQALSGAECLEMVKYFKYDIIFMDHMMPEMDGIETYFEMQKLGENINKDTPVIVLTANAIEGNTKMYKEAGFIDCLYKPVKYQELESMLIQYLPKDKVNLTDDVSA